MRILSNSSPLHSSLASQIIVSHCGEEETAIIDIAARISVWVTSLARREPGFTPVWTGSGGLDSRVNLSTVSLPGETDSV